tara:strand:+ start:362 stop:2194 length:1833 start_codon:yes stop_codon:yes gene_type:complete
MNKIMQNYIIWLLIISSLFAKINVLEQVMKINKHMTTEERKNLSRAKSHERAGLYNEAELIYNQLFNKNPGNQLIFSAYKSFLNKRSDWESLIQISILYSEAISPNPFGKVAVADSYILAGEDQMAFDIFNDLFRNHSNDIEKLKRFISKLMHHNKIDYGLEKIFNIRNEFNSPDFYSKDLGRYYYSKMEYSKSLNEYILYAIHNPNKLNEIRDKLMRFPQEDEIKEDIRKILKNYNSKLCNIILAEYEFKWENYSTAYNVMINNYRNDVEMYDFAIDMMVASQFMYAEQIFNQLILSKNKKIQELCIYQLANIISLKAKNAEKKLPISDHIIESTFFDLKAFYSSKIKIESTALMSAISMYDSIANQYNNPKARYKLAELKYEANNNILESINDFDYIEQKIGDKDISFMSAMKIIDLNIMNGQANPNLINQIQKYEKKYKKRDELALLNLKKNQILFYMQDFKSVEENIKKILKELPKDNEYYNEFIDGFSTLMLFDSNEEELSKFSSAIYSIKQNNLSSAISFLLELNSSEQEVIINLSSYYLSYIYIKLNDYSLAEEIISQVNGNDIYSQIIKLLAAELDDYMYNDLESAMDKYLYFLDNYNSSIY